MAEAASLLPGAPGAPGGKMAALVPWVSSPSFTFTTPMAKQLILVSGLVTPTLVTHILMLIVRPDRQAER